MTGGITFEGLDRLEAVLEAGADAAENHLGPAVSDVAHDIFATSQRKVPVDTGTLRSSGSVSSPKKDFKGWEVKISYGGAAAAYAVYVHENLETSHDPPTGAKYLEEPVKDAEHDFRDALAQAIVTRIAAAS